MSETVERPRSSPRDQAAAEWLPVQRVVAAGTVAILVLVQVVVIGEVVPPLALFSILYLAALAGSYRRTTAAVLTIGVLSVLNVVASLPFIVEDLARPSSAVPFTLTGVAVALAVLGVVGGVQTWREHHRGRRAAPVAAFSCVAFLAVGVVAGLTTSSDDLQTGDVALVTEHLEFVPEAITVAPGEVSIHIDNRDFGHHTFTIEELGVDVEVPGKTARRVVFDAEAGTYEVTCEVPGHETMTGTLQVG